MSPLVRLTAGALTVSLAVSALALAPAHARDLPSAPPAETHVPEIESLAATISGAGATRRAAAAATTPTVADLAALSQKLTYDDGTFDLVEATAKDMQAAMNAGVITSVQLTHMYLDRIAAYDRETVEARDGARPLNSIIATSKTALDTAAASDAARAKNGGPRGMLDGIPILVKDNYDTSDMPTTAGCGCWAQNQTSDDATMISGLRAAGAIILGKASLDEFAYGFASEFSSDSPVGQTKLVASPYNTTKTAGGSSGGTGAAIAANLGAIGFGTDTGGSIRVPSNYNQLVGVRPTVGLASRSGIVPLALSQDTGGPMARTVTDAAAALDAVVGADPSDPITAGADEHVPVSYTDGLDPHALEGVKLGYLPAMTETTNATTNRLFADALATLRAQGATVEPISIDGIDAILGEASGSTNEFKHDLDAYIAGHLAPAVSDRTLGDIIASGHYVTSRASVYNVRNAVTTEQYDTWMTSHSSVLAQGRALVSAALDDNDMAALIYPSGTTYGTWKTNMRLSPNTGLPAVTVPMGQATEADATVTGAGVNLEFLGRAFDEADVLGLAYDFEDATHARTTPTAYGAISGDVVAGPGTDTDAAGDGSTSVTASASTLTAGETFTVKVAASAADLYAYDLSLAYDPSALSLVSAKAGTSGSTSVSDRNGTIRIVHTKLGSSPGAQGATDLATLTFTAVKPGSTVVTGSTLTTVTTALVPKTVNDFGTANVSIGAPSTSAPGPISTSTVLKLSPSKVKRGGKVRAKITVRSGQGVPTGRVRVSVGGRLIANKAVPSTGKVTLTFRPRSVGSMKVKVRYLPTGRYLPSRAQSVVVVKRR